MNTSLELSPWKVCKKHEVGTTTRYGHEYRYVYEDKNAGFFEVQSITVEFFNHELQKVDTSNESSILKFCQSYGLVFSPMYPSKARGLAGRNSKFSYLNLFGIGDKNNQDLEFELQQAVHHFKTESDYSKKAIDTSILDSLSDGMGLGSQEAIASFFYGSEYGREDARKNKRAGAIVGLDELAITIRQLQVATVLVAAMEAGLSGNALVDYLYDKKILQQSYPQKLNEDLFIEPSFDGRKPRKITLEDLKTTAANAPDGNDYSSDYGVLDSIQRSMEFFLDKDFSEARDAAQAFLSRSKQALFQQNNGISLSRDLESIYASAIGKTEPEKEGSLLEGILACFDFVLSSDIEWKECANRRCGRMFKFHKEYDPTKRYRQAEYCKQSCRVLDSN